MNDNNGNGNGSINYKQDTKDPTENDGVGSEHVSILINTCESNESNSRFNQLKKDETRGEESPLTAKASVSVSAAAEYR